MKTAPKKTVTKKGIMSTDQVVKLVSDSLPKKTLAEVVQPVKKAMAEMNTQHVESKKKDEITKTNGNKDDFGFGHGTESSFIMTQLSKGKFTKPQILEAFLAHFANGANNAEIKRKKTSFSVFFSDVKKPFGTYHASRSLEPLLKENGVVHLDLNRVELIKKAITNGVLVDLRGLTKKNHAEKIKVVLKKHHLPTT